jgi:hypothetical protein
MTLTNENTIPQKKMKTQLQKNKNTNKEKQLKLRKWLINSDKSLNMIKSNDKPRSLISQGVNVGENQKLSLKQQDLIVQPASNKEKQKLKSKLKTYEQSIMQQHKIVINNCLKKMRK